PHWFRDSSWVAISLLTYYDFAKKADTATASSALDAASRIINFNINSISRFLGNITKLNNVDYEDPEFFNLKYHMPSRCGPNHEFFKSDIIDDTLESNTRHSWLMQYDSIPLILLSLQKKQEFYGLNIQETMFLRDNIRAILEYLGKVYITECPSMWEIDADKLHVYDVASIYSSFNFARNLSAKNIIDMNEEEINRIETRYYSSGTLGFIKRYFVNNNMLYSEKKPFSELPDISRGFDGSEIFAFNYFGIGPESLGIENIEERTIKGMEETLFGNNVLPIRFIGDIYFTGGRWLLLGLEFANYYAMHGNILKAKRIVEYIESKYKGSYPEQEIVNPASPNTDQGNYYALNGYKPIQKLAWSYASMIIASTTIMEKEKLLIRQD
ncbi:MAG: hypothetical protein ACP5RM_02570, partial [Candidatus Micrarchaeia archaeon]